MQLWPEAVVFTAQCFHPNKRQFYVKPLCGATGRLFSTAFVNDFLCILKGRVIISLVMLLMCPGSDCPAAPRLFAQRYGRAWKPATHHHPYSAQRRLLTRKTPVPKNKVIIPNLLSGFRRCIMQTPDLTSKLTFCYSLSFKPFSHSDVCIFLNEKVWHAPLMPRWNRSFIFLHRFPSYRPIYNSVRPQQAWDSPDTLLWV